MNERKRGAEETRGRTRLSGSEMALLVFDTFAVSADVWLLAALL